MPIPRHIWPAPFERQAEPIRLEAMAAHKSRSAMPQFERPPQHLQAERRGTPGESAPKTAHRKADERRVGRNERPGVGVVVVACDAERGSKGGIGPTGIRRGSMMIGPDTLER